MAFYRELLGLCAILTAVMGCTKPKPPVTDATLPLLRDDMVRATLASFRRSPTRSQSLIATATALPSSDKTENHPVVSARSATQPTFAAIDATGTDVALPSATKAPEQAASTTERSIVPSSASASVATIASEQPHVTSPIRETKETTSSIPRLDDVSEPKPIETQETALGASITSSQQERQSSIGANAWVTGAAAIDANNSKSGAGARYTGESAGQSGYTGFGAGKGYTGAGAGDRFTGASAGQSGYTGFGAGARYTGESAGQSGYTGFGAGKGYTGAGAGAAGFTGTAGAQPRPEDNVKTAASSIVVILPTPWGIYLEQLPTN
jgi:hypothetical protein